MARRRMGDALLNDNNLLLLVCVCVCVFARVDVKFQQGIGAYRLIE